MATGKRRPLHPGGNSGSSSPLGGSFRSSRLNFRPNSTSQENRGGTKPTASPSSVGLVLVTMLIHVCKKSLLFEPRLKVAIYCGGIFIVSLIADYATMPRSYFSRSDNVLNRYFVKWGWAWLLTVVLPWVVLSAHTLGCGRRSVVINHLWRLVVATIAWLLWIRLFNYIETNHGRCLNTKDPNHQSKAKCLQAGKFWSGFDISGHTFILIYSSLILAEEGAAFIGWEGIKDFVAKEEHSRNSNESNTRGHLRNLSNDDLEFLKKAHTALTPYLRGLFVVMTLQQILWEIMLISTMLYYHIMLEKMLGGIAAILTWYVTYRWWYKLPNGGLSAPGEGLFKYNDTKERHDNGNLRSRRNTLNGSGPRFSAGGSCSYQTRTYQDANDPLNSSRFNEPDLSSSSPSTTTTSTSRRT